MNVTLKVAELFTLKTELEGTDKRTGLLRQSLPLPVKFKLLQVYKRVSEITTDIENLQKETITKFGKEMENGNWAVEKDSENYDTCIKELEALMQEEQEIIIPEFTLEMFNIETDEVYPIFLEKLIRFEENTD